MAFGAAQPEMSELGGEPEQVDPAGAHAHAPPTHVTVFGAAQPDTRLGGGVPEQLPVPEPDGHVPVPMQE